jgi:hypothetical protein
VPKPKYTTPEARQAAAVVISKMAREQMLAQWEQKRENSGQDLGYYGCHRRVRKARGRAADQVCVTCGSQARHWAHIRDMDPGDPQNYQPMCQGCHWTYDDVPASRNITLGAEGRRTAALKAWETKRRKRAGDVALPPSLAGDG